MGNGNIIIIAKNIIENSGGSIRQDAGGNIINHAGGRLIQTAEKGIKYGKYQKPKPPTDVRVTKLEGPFENIDGKPVDKIKLRTPYLYKASLTRKPSPIEEGFLRWAVQLDEDEKVLMNNTSSNQKVEEDKVWLVITINKEFEKARVYAYFRAPSKKKSVELSLKNEYKKAIAFFIGGAGDKTPFLGVGPNENIREVMDLFGEKRNMKNYLSRWLGYDNVYERKI